MLQIPLPLAQLVLSAINHVSRQQFWLRDVMAPHAGRVVRIHVLPPSPEPDDAPFSTRRRNRARTSKTGQTPAGRSYASYLAVDAAATPGAGQAASAGAAGKDGAPSPLGLPSLQTDARIGADGSLSAVSGEEPSVVLTARPTVDAVFRAMREGPMALGATLRIEGDAMLAQALGEVARAMNWDVEEDLSRVVGDAAAHRAGQFLRDARGHAAEAGSRLRDALTDHLSSESGVLVSRPEFEAWRDDVQSLTERIERLEKQTPSSH